MCPDSVETLCKSIGSTIRKLRLKKYPDRGSLKNCVQEFDGALSTWMAWEAGKVLPSHENQEKLASFFGITLAYLRGEHASPNEPTVYNILELSDRLENQESLVKLLKNHNYFLQQLLNSISGKYGEYDVDFLGNTMNIRDCVSEIAKIMERLIDTENKRPGVFERLYPSPSNSDSE